MTKNVIFYRHASTGLGISLELVIGAAVICITLIGMALWCWAPGPDKKPTAASASLSAIAQLSQPSAAVSTEGSTRVALVMGNAAYPDAPAQLAEPVDDAHALGDELARRGFEVSVGTNVKKSQMQALLDNFYAKAASSAMAAVFFSGFGLQSEHQSYLIPVDAQIWNEADVRRDAFSLDSVIMTLTRLGVRAKVLIVDASRRNPFEPRYRTTSGGLAFVTLSQNSAVMFSTRPDTVVNDGVPHVFVPQLLTILKTTSSTIKLAFERTQIAVSRETNGLQLPWYETSFDQDLPLGQTAPR